MKDETLATFMLYHRTLAGLTPNGLAHRTTSMSSATVLDIELGIRTDLRPRPARQLARGLELDDWDTDRFLYLVGCAPTIDWQSLAMEIMTELGLSDLLRSRAAEVYARGETNPTPEEATDGDRTPAL